MANSCTPFSTFKICNIKSVWCTKLKKIAKNLVFDYLDHSKRHFSDFWMIHHEVMMAKSCRPFSSIKICNIESIRCSELEILAKNLVFDYLDHSKRHFLIFEWSSMGCMEAKSCTPFSSIKICNIKLFWCTKFKKRAKNLIYGYSDHPKRHFSDFWIIQHDYYNCQIVNTM